MVWFDYVLVWSGRFHIVWCMFIVQICYHAKSGACSFKNVRVMPILVLFGMVWFGLVIFWFGLVWYDSPSFGVCSLSRYVTMQNLELVASKMSELYQY